MNVQIGDLSLGGKPVQFGVCAGTVSRYRRYQGLKVVDEVGEAPTTHDFWIKTDDDRDQNVQTCSVPKDFSLSPGQRVTLISGHHLGRWSWLFVVDHDRGKLWPLNPPDWFLRWTNIVPSFSLQSWAGTTVVLAFAALPFTAFLAAETTVLGDPPTMVSAIVQSVFLNCFLLPILAIGPTFVANYFRRRSKGRRLDEHVVFDLEESARKSAVIDPRELDHVAGGAAT